MNYEVKEEILWLFLMIFLLIQNVYIIYSSDVTLNLVNMHFLVIGVLFTMIFFILTSIFRGGRPGRVMRGEEELTVKDVKKHEFSSVLSAFFFLFFAILIFINSSGISFSDSQIGPLVMLGAFAIIFGLKSRWIKKEISEK